MNVPQNTTDTLLHAQLSGHLLREGEYLVERQLGHVGGEKTYLAAHTALALPFTLKRIRADRPLPEKAIVELEHILAGGAIPHSPTGYGQEPGIPTSGGEHSDRFLREALLLARLQHPAIPTLYDYFFEDSYWYLVLDYVPGFTLSSYLHKHAPLDPLEALGYSMQLCDILEYLHSQTPPIILRNLEPGNIVLTRAGSLMLINIGNACLLKDRPHPARRATGYSAPELAPDDEEHDTRSDLYSLGVLLHEMLSGHKPQNGQVLDALHLINTETSHTLSALVKLATRAEPRHRFQSAHTFYLALERAYSIEERHSYQRHVIMATTDLQSPTGVSDERAQAKLESNGNARSSGAGVAQALTLQRRLQTRGALHAARLERLEQEQLEIQLASVDESLQRRSSMSLSQLSLPCIEDAEIPIVLAPAATVAFKAPAKQRLWRRAIGISFLLALIFFLIVLVLLFTQPKRQPASPPTVASPTAGITTTSEPDAWRALPSLAVPVADNTSVYVTLQGRTYIYVSGGYMGTQTPERYDHSLYRYDIAAAHWEKVEEQFPAMINNSAALDKHGHIYFTAGYTPDTSSVASLLYVYQPDNRTLQKIVPSAQTPIGFGGAMLADQQQHLYLTQGFSRAGDPHEHAGNGWYRYDIATAQWHILAPLPVGLGYVALTSDNNGGILMLGGATDAGQHTQSNAIYHYDSSHNSWTQTAITLPQPLSGMASCQPRSGQIALVGGYEATHNTGLASTWLFDTRLLQWQRLTALPIGGSVLGSAACDGNGHLFLLRGADDPHQPTHDFWFLSLAQMNADRGAKN